MVICGAMLEVLHEGGTCVFSGSMYFVNMAVYMFPNVKDILTLGYMVKELLRAG